DIEAIVLGLIDLVFVQRFTTVDLPLSIGLLRPIRSPRGRVTWGLLVRFHLSGHGHLQTLRGTSGKLRYKRIDCSTNSRLQQCHSLSYDVTDVTRRAPQSSLRGRRTAGRARCRRALRELRERGGRGARGWSRGLRRGPERAEARPERSPPRRQNPRRGPTQH